MKHVRELAFEICSCKFARLQRSIHNDLIFTNGEDLNVRRSLKANRGQQRKIC